MKLIYKMYLLFLDDIHAVNNGSPLPRYDAFLLYDNADMQSANAVVEQLEINYKLKVIHFFNIVNCKKNMFLKIELL